jgi:outer membrane protein OmpA-like peptidoglycan-associated protein
MNCKPILLVFLLLNAFSAFAGGADTVKVFYDINIYQLSPTDKLKITTLINSLKPTDTVKIIGYADYLGSDKTNIMLSENRAETVFNYLLTLPKNLKVITEWVGGVPPTGKKKTFDGEPVNRRVDIIKAAFNAKKNPVPINPATKQLVFYSAPAPVKAPQKQVVIATPEDKRPFKVKVNDLGTLNAGNSVSLQEITFQPGRHFLNPESVQYIEELLSYLKSHNNIIFEIQGHICCGNDDGDSFDYDTRESGLSTNRAKFIYDYFVEKGISANRMSYKGLGSSKPKVWPENSEHDRYLNRRVEILIVNR